MGAHLICAVDKVSEEGVPGVVLGFRCVTSAWTSAEAQPLAEPPTVPVAQIKRCWQRRHSQAAGGQRFGNLLELGHVSICVGEKQPSTAATESDNEMRKWRRAWNWAGKRVIVWVWNGLKIGDKASGRQAPLASEPRSELFHYAANLKNVRHREPRHLCRRRAVRNNSLWRICDGLSGENCSDINGPGHVVCHSTWHIRRHLKFQF